MITRIIDYDPQTGQLNVQGPLHDRLFMMGLLERAKDAVREFDPAKQPGILLAPPGTAGTAVRKGAG